MDKTVDVVKIQRLKRGMKIIEGNQSKVRQDGYSNMLNKYGTPQDNSTAYNYTHEKLTDDMTLTSLYESNGLFAKIIDRPSEEALKHGLDIDFGDIDIQQYIESQLDRLCYEEKFIQAEKWTRLYGGAIIVMMVDDGRLLDEPLNWREVRRIEDMRVFERAVVQPDYTNLFTYNDFEKRKGNFGEPEYYCVYSIYGYFRVHYSRCLIFRNGKLPEITTSAIYRYWGIPEHVKIKKELRECITSHSYGNLLLERSAQAIYKMKNLANLLSTEKGEDAVVQRLQIIDMARSILNSIAIDNEGEDYDYKQLNLSGVKDVLDSTCNMLSAVTEIPQTILFGRSPSGMNSTGESDMENYYNMVEKIQKVNMKTNTRTLIDIIIKQGLYDGSIKEKPNYKVKFAELWSMSAVEKAQIEQTEAQTEQIKAQTANVYLQAGVLDPTEVRNTIAKEGKMELEEVLSIDDEDYTKEINIPQDNDIANQNDGEEDIEASAVIVVDDGKILCADRSDGKGLCGAGGHRENSETPYETAFRETQEEFDIVPLNLIDIGCYEPTGEDYLKTKVYVTDEYAGEAKADGKEMFNERWLTMDELEKENLFPPFAESIEMLKEFIRGGIIGE